MFDNKRSCALKLQQSGCEDAFARTYMSPLAAWYATQNNPSALFFIKLDNATRGAGMCVISRNQLLSCRLSPKHVIQQAVQDLELINGRKFVVRYYVLVHNRRVFMHRRGAVIVHGATYHRNSTDYKVQIQHDFDKPGSEARLMTLDSICEGSRWRTAIAERFAHVMPALRPLIDATSPDLYTLMGGDALIESTGSAKFVEFNFFPAMFANSLDFNTRVSQPVLRDVITKTMLGATDTEFDEIRQRPHQQGWQQPQATVPAA